MQITNHQHVANIQRITFTAINKWMPTTSTAKLPNENRKIAPYLDHWWATPINFDRSFGAGKHFNCNVCKTRVIKTCAGITTTNPACSWRDRKPSVATKARVLNVKCKFTMLTCTNYTNTTNMQSGLSAKMTSETEATEQWKNLLLPFDLSRRPPPKKKERESVKLLNRPW